MPGVRASTPLNRSRIPGVTPYAFHIAEAQAFIDGNKRAGVDAALTFLTLNGFRILDQDDVLYLAMIEIAERKMNKAQLANMLRELSGI